MKKTILLSFVFFVLSFVVFGCSFRHGDKSIKASSQIEIINTPSKEGAYVISVDDRSVMVVDATPKDFSATGGLKEFYSAIVYSNVTKKLEVGQRVVIENDGPILESFPAQGKAKSVTILPTYKPEKSELTEAQVVKVAVKRAFEKSDWVPAIRYVEYNEENDMWKVGIRQEENIYEVNVEDKR